MRDSSFEDCLLSYAIECDVAFRTVELNKHCRSLHLDTVPTVLNGP